MLLTRTGNRLICATRFSGKTEVTAQSLLEIQNATIWRGDTCVFEDLNLSINVGEQIAILGPNGCGKTTLLMTLNRELYPVASKHSHLRVLGRQSWNVWELRRQIGIISNDLQRRYPLDAHALDMVVSGFHSSIGTHGIIAERVSPREIAAATSILETLGVGDLATTRLRDMSTGQQRRCLLARALVHDPAILIFDEPTAGLDFAASFDYLQRIRRLAQEGKSILVVTHHLNEIPPEIQRVIVLAKGKVVADGPKHAVLQPEVLSDAYETTIKVREIEGFYLAYPG